MYHCEHGFLLCYHFILLREENNYGRMHIQMAIVSVAGSFFIRFFIFSCPPLAEILPIRRKTLSNQSVNRSIFHIDILCLTEDVNSKVFPVNSTSLTPNTSCVISYSELSSHGYSDPTTSASEYKATIMADLVEIQALSIY